ncbi:MAG TPA: flippase [Methanomassiliicoccales archaeon]|nr:flippase [Methanomassiliicoccales archaeon]
MRAGDSVIGRRSFVYLAFRLVISLLGFVGLYFMTRYLGTENYGAIMFAMSVVATFNAVSDLGFGSAHVKKISEGKDISDSVSTYIVIKIVLTAMMVIVTVIGLLFWQTFMGGRIDGPTGSLVILFILYYALYNLTSIVTTTYSATMEMFKCQLVGFIDPIIRIPLVAIVCLGSASAIGVAYAYVGGALAAMSLAMLLLFRDKVKLKRPTLYREYLSFALPLALIGVIGSVAGNMDKLMLGFYYGNSAVGTYSAAQVFMSIFALVGSAVATMTFPSFSKMHTDGNMEEIRSTTWQAERYISMIGMPITALIVLFPTETARVMLGSNIAGAGDPMRFMALTTMLVLLNQVHSSQILAVNRPDLSAKVTMATFLVNFALLVIFVPASFLGIPALGLSYEGAAVAILIGNAIMWVVMRYIVWRLTGTGSNVRILLHVLAAIVAGLALIPLAYDIPLGGWLQMIIWGAYTLTIFLGVLTLLNEFDRDDLNYFLSILSVRELWEYFRAEMKLGKGKANQ